MNFHMKVKTRLETYPKHSPFYHPLDEKLLDKYLQRVRFEGKVNPSLECLEALHYLHPRHIPFENLNPLLGLEVRLDTRSLVDKLVLDNRGGYCFEHNLLFGAILRGIGFQVTSLAARVLWQLPEGKIMPRDHMVLLVKLEGIPYLVDVGWGGNTVTRPLLLHTEEIQLTSHEPMRIIAKEGLHVLSIQIEDEWQEMHQFGLEEYLLPDYEVISWCLCNHPESIFVKDLMAARVIEDGRIALKNNLFSKHSLDGSTKKQTLGDLSALKRVLTEEFGIQLPKIKKMDQLLSEILKREG